MEIVKDLVESVPRSVWILLILVIGGLAVAKGLSRAAIRQRNVNEGVFRARLIIVIFLAGLAAFSCWTAIAILDVIVTSVSIIMAGFLGFGSFVLVRSRIRVTPDEVEYFDGWRKRVRISRSDILSAEVRHPGAILVVRCVNKKDNFTVPLIAYSRAGLLVALLKRSAMRI